MLRQIVRRCVSRPLSVPFGQKPQGVAFYATKSAAASKDEDMYQCPEWAKSINLCPQPPIKLYASPKEFFTTDDIFKQNKRVVVFGYPSLVSATPNADSSSGVHPNFIRAEANIRGRNVDKIVCVVVDSPQTTKAWSDANLARHTTDNVLLLADPDASFAKLLGVDVDMMATGEGIRSKRYSFIAQDGQIKMFSVDTDPHKIKYTDPVVILDQLDMLDGHLKHHKISRRDWTHEQIKKELAEDTIDQPDSQDKNLPPSVKASQF